MDSPTMRALTSALDFGSKRFETISNNLSNVNTPGYQRRDVSFGALLQLAGQGDDLGLDTARTDPRHILAETDGSLAPRPEVTVDSNKSMRQDGNSVDVDAETAALAATQIYYEAASQMLAGQFTALKYVIRGD